MELLLQNIRTKIFTLPDDTLVLSGHGPVTTVGHEKAYNFFSGINATINPMDWDMTALETGPH